MKATHNYPFAVRLDAMSKQMTFQDLQTALAGMSRAEANELADRANIARSTVAKIRKQHTENPRIATILPLIAMLQKTAKRRKAE